MLAILAWRVDLAAVAAQLARVDPGPLVAALAVYGFSLLFHALRWRALLRSRGLDPGLATLLRLILGASFLNLILPGNLGGDVYRVVGSRREAASLLQSAGLVLLERYCGFLAAFLMALAALAAGDFGSRQPGLALLVVALFVAFLLPVPLMANRRTEAAVERLFRRMKLERLAAAAARSAAAVRDLVGSPRLVAVVLALSAAMKVCVGAILILLAAALGLRLDLLDILVFLPLHSVVSALPVTINGLGLREANLVGFFSQIGLETERAASLAFLHLIWLYATALPGALALGRPGSNRRAAAGGDSRIG